MLIKIYFINIFILLHIKVNVDVSIRERQVLKSQGIFAGISSCIIVGCDFVKQFGSVMTCFMMILH